jgi:HK97 family phage prohead protease
VKRELRTFVAQELRATGSASQPKIEGYAATFSGIADLGTFKEKIAPGAFTRTLAEGDEVVCLFNHSDNMLLGRLTAGTLTLRQDDKGLWFSCDLPDTSIARDVHANLRAGNLKECSFGFFVDGPDGEQWSQMSDGSMLRTLVSVRLADVSVVTFPAYDNTNAAARNVVADYAEARMSAVRAAGADLSNLGVVPFVRGDAMSDDTYNSDDEANGIINWAEDSDEDRSADAPVKNKLKASQGFLYVKGDGSKRSDYVGPHHTIVDGKLAHSQIGALRCAKDFVSGNLDIPAEHRAAAKQHLDSELGLWFGDGDGGLSDDQRQAAVDEQLRTRLMFLKYT